MSCCCDDLNQPPGAMADHRHHQQQPIPIMADAYPRDQIADSVAFMHEILSELEGAVPDVRHDLVRLLGALGKDAAAGDSDAVAVGSRVVELLRAHHPGVLRRFAAHVHMDVVPAEQGRLLASSSLTPPPPRRSRSRRRRDATPAAAPSVAQALAFVKRVHETAGPVVHGRFLAVLAEAKGGGAGGEGMFADEIYERARRAFGPAHVGLLHAFATAWLPGAREWKLQQQQARPPPAATATAASTSMHAGMLLHSEKKPRPRADDNGNNGRRHDDRAFAAVLEVRNVKKRRRDDDVDGGTDRVGVSSGGGAAAHGHHTGVHHAYSDDSDKKPPRRRVAMGGKSSSAGSAAAAVGPPERDDDEVRRFRREWEFQTWYSKLVATSNRVKELRPPPHGDGGGDGDISVEALFPLPECLEFLGSFYGGRWGEMAAALERGESRVPALEAIARRLADKEEEAVAEESRRRRRHDPARVAQRLHALAAAMHAPDEERRRRHHGGGA